jgi:hypothetical protein
MADADVLIKYIDCTRHYYRALGYAQDYIWTTFDDVPFSELAKPMAASIQPIKERLLKLGEERRRQRATAKQTPAPILGSLVQITTAGPSAESMNKPSMPFARRSVSTNRTRGKTICRAGF